MRPHENLEVWKKAVEFVAEPDYIELKAESDSIGRILVGLSKHLKTKKHDQ